MSVSKSFFVSRAFERFGAKCSSSGAFGFDDVLGLFLKTPLRHRVFFCELWLRPQVFLENFLSFFPKQSRFYSPDSNGDPKSEQTTLVMVSRKLEWKLDFRALARSSAEGPSIVVAIGTSRVRWSMVREKKTNKKQGSQPVIVRRLNPSSSANQRVPRPNVATVSHFAVFVDVDVQLQDGQAAARGQRRKAVIRDISGVDHWGVTNGVHRSGELSPCARCKKWRCWGAVVAKPLYTNGGRGRRRRLSAQPAELWLSEKSWKSSQCWRTFCMCLSHLE